MMTDENKKQVRYIIQNMDGLIPELKTALIRLLTTTFPEKAAAILEVVISAVEKSNPDSVFCDGCGDELEPGEAYANETEWLCEVCFVERFGQKAWEKYVEQEELRTEQDPAKIWCAVCQDPIDRSKLVPWSGDDAYHWLCPGCGSDLLPVQSEDEYFGPGGEG